LLDTASVERPIEVHAGDGHVLVWSTRRAAQPTSSRLPIRALQTYSSDGDVSVEFLRTVALTA